MLEWTASVMIAIEPVIAPAATFSTIRTEFDTTDSRAAPNLVDPSTAAGAISGARRWRGTSPGDAASFTTSRSAPRRARGRRARGG